MSENPRVPAEYVLLLSHVELNDVIVDLYGRSDKEGFEVCDITLTGDKRSLVAWFTNDELRSIERGAELSLAQIAREQNAENKLDRVAFERFMNKL